MKIEFDPIKLGLQILSQIIWNLPLILAIDYFLEAEYNITSSSWLWWVIIVLFWRWIDWGYKLRKFADSWKDDEK